MQESPLYRELEFPTNFSVIDTLDDLKALVDTLYESDKLLGFDIETGYSGKDTPKESTNVYSDRQFIVGFSITNDFSWARYVPLKHDFGQNIDPEKAWELMKPLLEEKKGVIHNYHFEASNLREIEAKGDGPSIVLPISNWYDSMLEAYVLADVPANRISGSIAGGELVRRYLPPFHRTEDMFAAEHASSFAVNLKSLTKFRYNYDQKNIFTLFNGGKDLTAKQKESIRFNTLPIDENVAHYACDDAVFCLQLHNDQFARIMEDDYLPFVYNLEREIADILVDMSKSGVGVDWDGINNHLGMYEHFLDRMLSDTRKKFEKETGSSQASLNFKSAPQMRKVIYGPKEEGGLGLTTSVETDSGEKSTSEKALTTLRKESPAINSLLNYRQCIKMGNWFEQIKSFEGRYNDNRLHPGFLQTVVPSGRFSSSGPNVQQIAKRWWFQIPDGSVAEVMEEGTLGEDYWTGNARDFIVPEEGYSLLSFDYASAEIQMVGALAQEKEIMDAFHRGEDFHKWAASLMYSKPISEVTKKERQSAKAQPVSEPVLTPDGWKPIGKIKSGDYVISGTTGKPVLVKSVHPQGEKDIYEFSTTDGATRCTEDHLWTVKSESDRWPWKTVTTRSLIDSGLRRTSGQLKWMLPERPVINYGREDALPVDPYILGMLLGDGTFRHSWAPSYSSADYELIEAMAAYHESIGGRVEERQINDNFWTLYLACEPYTSGPRNVMRNPLRLGLRDLGLDNLKSENKFIPEKYLRAAPESRLALLQGILDTDGNVLNGGAEFCSVSKELAEGVVEIVRSLGGKATLSMREQSETALVRGKVPNRLRYIYRVYLRFPEHVEPFRLTRKVDKRKHVPNFPLCRVTGIEKIGSEEAVCISVDSEDGLYITNDFVVTHNTYAFGSLYGQSVAALAQQLGVTKEEGERMQSMYFAPFPRLAGYFDQQHTMAEKDLEVRTMIGRKITLWNGMHDNGKIRSGAKRVSVNAPVQGSATGDYVKIAMVNVRNVLRQNGWWGTKVKLIMNQHDSLVFEVSNELDMKEVVDTLTPAVQYNLAGVQGFYNEFEEFPPMNVDWEAGHSWGSIVSIDDYHLLGVERITLSFDSTPTVEDVKTLNAVMHTNPGNTVVGMRINGEYVGTLNHSIASSPDVFKKFKYGDPDIGIQHAIGDKVSIDIP